MRRSGAADEPVTRRHREADAEENDEFVHAERREDDGDDAATAAQRRGFRPAPSLQRACTTIAMTTGLTP